MSDLSDRRSFGPDSPFDPQSDLSVCQTGSEAKKRESG